MSGRVFGIFIDVDLDLIPSGITEIITKFLKILKLTYEFSRGFSKRVTASVFDNAPLFLNNSNATIQMVYVTYQS